MAGRTHGRIICNDDLRRVDARAVGRGSRGEEATVGERRATTAAAAPFEQQRARFTTCPFSLPPAPAPPLMESARPPRVDDGPKVAAPATSAQQQ